MSYINKGQSVVIQTIEVAFNAASVNDSNSADKMSALLSEEGTHAEDGIILDWRYTGAERTVVAPTDCEEGSIFNVATSESATREELAGALIAVMGVLPTIYKKAGFIHIPTDAAIKKAQKVLALLEREKQPAEKFYLCALKERNGQYEYKHFLRFSTTRDPHEVAREKASIWYSEEPVVADGDSYDFNCGEVSLSVNYVREISFHVFKALEGIVTDITEKTIAENKCYCAVKVEQDGRETDLGSFQMFEVDGKMVFDYNGISEELINRQFTDDEDKAALVTKSIENDLNEKGTTQGIYALDEGTNLSYIIR